MNVGSLFSGIGGMDYGLHRAGHEHVFFCESDEWRRQVLAARWPGVPIYDDVAQVASGISGGGGYLERDGARADAERDGSPLPVEPAGPDLLAGGFPCQDLSVAGQRRGLAGSRSGLFFEFARIIDAFRPGWVLVENVPGLLSSNGGRDFGVVLGTLADLGYGLGWRVLDSRFFGVPQRRRRVFIVGARADGDPAAAAERAGEVLAVGSRCPRHPATRGEAREDAAVASLSGLGNGGPDDNDGQAGRILSYATGDGVNAPGRRQEDDVNIVPIETQAWQWHLDTGTIGLHDHSPALDKANPPAVGVRRLTPTECERLQGLPDGWTLLDTKTPDSRRYSALGDAVTANVAEWIGRRLSESEAA